MTYTIYFLVSRKRAENRSSSSKLWYGHVSLLRIPGYLSVHMGEGMTDHLILGLFGPASHAWTGQARHGGQHVHGGAGGPARGLHRHVLCRGGRCPGAVRLGGRLHLGQDPQGHAGHDGGWVVGEQTVPSRIRRQGGGRYRVLYTYHSAL